MKRAAVNIAKLPELVGKAYNVTAETLLQIMATVSYVRTFVQMVDPHTKGVMLSIAQDYEKLAV